MQRLLLFSLSAFAERFDAYSFAVPRGYQVQRDANVVVLLKTNSQPRDYCQFALYRLQRSTGDANQDAQKEWKNTVLNTQKQRGDLESKPLPIPNAPNSVVLASETIDNHGANSYTSLFVIRPPDGYFGVRFIVPTKQAFEACQSDVALLIPSLRMNATTPQTPTGATGGIVGVWERLSVSKLPGQFNPVTSQWEYNRTSDKYSFRNIRRFKFEPNGAYTFEFDGEETYYQQRNVTIERGTYAVKGDILSLTPRECHSGKSPKSQTPQLKPCATPAASGVRIAVGAELQMLESDGAWAAYKPVPAR